MITAKGKKLLGGIVFVALAFFGLRYASKTGYGMKLMGQFSGEKIVLDDKTTDAATPNNAALAALPTSNVVSGAPQIRANFWAWNAQMGCLYANGGGLTTKGSLMDKQGVRMSIKRQDDNNQLMAELTALAKGMKDGQTDPSNGVHFVAIMGDGSHAFLSALNAQLVEAYGDEYRAEIVGSCGKSAGEDALFGPVEWKVNPQSLRGALIAAVIRDGDWNIVVRYALDNDVPINVDENTYDPQAVNFVNPKTYMDASQKYVAGYCEERKVVNDGKPTGETKKVCVDGVATWTPGDVVIAREKGGLVRVISTKEYANQMPNVIIGIRRWNQTHKDLVVKMLDAFTQGGDQVLSHDQALDKAAEISNAVYQEANFTPALWKAYYVGVTEKDKMGGRVELGGSRAFNLADNLVLFGLAEGTSPGSSRFRATYTSFGKIVNKMYPSLVPTEPDAEKAVDLTYLRALATKRQGETGTAETVAYNATGDVTREVGRRAVQIQFLTGSAELTANGVKQLEQLYDELSINTLRVIIHGHTDNVGSPDANMQLSEDRALAVKTWLEGRGKAEFPPNRISVKAHGQTEPVASNKTAEGKAKNRRVEVVIGQ